MAAKSAYGSNPHAGINPNDDHGWGHHHWPNGVPGTLLAVVTVPGSVRIVVRRELAELVGLNYQIADVKYGRQFTRGWTGGYENRPISGTQTPSNHSKGKAIDNDAQDNPMSHIFQCNIPPELVADWESTGWYWGGRYSSKSDTMHFEYCFSPADVPRHVARARAILAAVHGVAPVPLWPALPAGHFLGPDGAPESHSGNPASDGPDVRAAVAEVQQLITRLGFNAGGADGRYGSNTGRAVTAWQHANGFIESGLIGKNDWDALHPAVDQQQAATEFPGTLRRGLRGSDVERLQHLLIDHGDAELAAKFPTGPGIFGPATEAAVRRFQQAHGLVVDGIVGRVTWAALTS